MPRFLLILTISLASLPAAASHRRSVRTSDLGCSYSIASSIAAPLAQDGVNHLMVGLQGVTSSCREWAASTDADWITVEVTATGVFLTVAPNTTFADRTAVVMIAGRPYEVTQLGQSNLLRNGSFDSDITPWSWGEFPNSTGSAVWTPLDATGNSQSGSIRLRDSKTGDQAFQRMQCVNAEPDSFEYGFTVRSEAPAVTWGVIAFLNFTGENCTGTYPAYSAKTVKPEKAGVWETAAYTGKLVTGYKSFMVVIGSYAKESGASADIWIDDIYVRPRD